MNEQVVEDVEDLGQPAADGELVHWMSRKPLQLGPAGISAAAGAAFTVGVLVTVAVLAATHWIGPDREVELPRRRFRG